ncbi:MAG: tyrosine-type recombinase/integrase [Myxococcaceae bacterium]
MSKLISMGGGAANAMVLRYRTVMVDQGFQATTINRRLAALRSLVKLARTLGVVSWSIEIPNLKAEAYRDTRGPGLSAFCQMLELAEQQHDAKARRDVAILRLLFDLALRASELTSLDIVDFDAPRQAIHILGKGKTQKVPLSMPPAASDALSRWVEVRGGEHGPLFLNCDRAGKGERLTRSGVYELVRKLGRRVGVETRPHGLRHLSITEACKVAQANGFGLEEVLDHSRHASVGTLLIYRDRERNVQGEIAGLISSKVERART